MDSTDQHAIPAAQQLVGLTLEGGWKVMLLLQPSPVASGGNFSCGYEVESQNGKRAFLKALDYSTAMQSPDPAQALNAMTSAYIFERDLLNRCSSRGLTRVVTAITSGKVIIGPSLGDLVEYLIFERADGDVRKQMEAAEEFDLAWRFSSLHHIATGLKQLHGERIAHQDVKPSNVLLFQRDAKLADLGRAACHGMNPPHEPFRIAGDPSYAPPELLYGFLSPEWSIRRLGCDAYLLGSMVVWFFTGLSSTGLLINQLAEEHRPYKWQGTYEDVLPYVRNAFTYVLTTFDAHIPLVLSSELTSLVIELCEPDPLRRGHPKERTDSQFSLERYITRFDLLAKRARYSRFAYDNGGGVA
jgi:serine/threonine protein kinase